MARFHGIWLYGIVSIIVLVLLPQPSGAATVCETVLNGSVTVAAGEIRTSSTFDLQSGETVVVTAQHEQGTAFVKLDVQRNVGSSPIGFNSGVGSVILIAQANVSGIYDVAFDADEAGTITYSVQKGSACIPDRGDGSNISFYNYGYQVLGFVKPEGKFHIYADCEGTKCSLIAEIKISVLDASKSIHFDEDPDDGWHVEVFPIADGYRTEGAVQYQVNTYLNDVLQDDKLDLLVWKNGRWFWRAATYR